MNGESWQEILWALPTAMGWRWYALWGALAVTGAGIVFFKLILDHEFSALLVGRVIMGVGAILIPLSALQSGWQPWIPAFYAVNVFLMGVLIGTGWCEREDKSLTVRVALWRWAVRQASAAVTWLCGPHRPGYRPDGGGHD